MQNLKHLSVPNIVNSIDDGVVAYCLSKGSTAVLSIDIESLSIATQFVLPNINVSIKPSVDDDYLYAADLVGNILKVDKFSGVISSKIEIGQCIPIGELVKDGDFLFMLCGVPLSYGNAIDTNKMSFVSINTKTGKKAFQSHLLSKNTFTMPVAINGRIYFSAGKTLYHYKDEQFGHIPLSFNQTFITDTLDGRAISLSQSGTLEAFGPDHKLYARFLISPSSSRPYAFNHFMVWPTKNGIYKIDVDNRKNTQISELNDAVLSGSIQNNSLYLVCANKTIKITEQVEVETNRELLNPPIYSFFAKNRFLFIYPDRITSLEPLF